jgi:hypothetical protein
MVHSNTPQAQKSAHTHTRTPTLTTTNNYILIKRIAQHLHLSEVQVRGGFPMHMALFHPPLRLVLLLGFPLHETLEQRNHFHLPKRVSASLRDPFHLAILAQLLKRVLGQSKYHESTRQLLRSTLVAHVGHHVPFAVLCVTNPQGLGVQHDLRTGGSNEEDNSMNQVSFSLPTPSSRPVATHTPSTSGWNGRTRLLFGLGRAKPKPRQTTHSLTHALTHSLTQTSLAHSFI